MKLMFMLCNNCMYLCAKSKDWLVDYKNCTCIFLEEQEMNITRKTFWSNGEVSTRPMSFAIEDSQEFIDGQRRRVNNGPGIDSVHLLDRRNRCYMIITPVSK